jgi:hypothetical protein
LPCSFCLFCCEYSRASAGVVSIFICWPLPAFIFVCAYYIRCCCCCYCCC